jgi:hypothetical protein
MLANLEICKQSSVPCAHPQLLQHAEAVSAAELAQRLHLGLPAASLPSCNALHRRQKLAEDNQEAGQL